jgi:hypothetical protein
MKSLKKLLLRPRLLSICLQFAALSCLAAAALLATYRSCRYLSGHADSLVYPFLLQHFKLHDLLLPGQHTNLLKFPLFYMQGILPYTFSTFMAVSAGLTLVSFALWLFLSRRVVGGLPLVVFATYLLCVIVGSPIFIYALSGTTIRNIEYPIALLFTIACGRLLITRALSKKAVFLISLAIALYTLTCAGDSFFLYTVTPALLLTLGLCYWKYPSSTTRNEYIKWAALAVIGSSLVAVMLSHLLDAVGVIVPYTDPIFKPHILPLSHLAPSIAIAFTELLDMFGANIFGRDITTANALVFFNFALLITGIVGLVQIIWHSTFAKKRSTAKRGEIPFILLAVAITYFMIIGVYIISDLVVRQTASGAIVSAGQARYLSFLPLLLGFGVVYALRSVGKSVGKSAIFWLVALIVIAMSTGLIRQNLTYDLGMRNSEITVAQTAAAQHIKLLVGGYWYGVGVKFWSNNQIDYASVVGCNIPQPVYNNRVSWYKTDATTTKSALIVVRTGLDAPFWRGCSDEQLIATYGKPAQVIQIHNSENPTLWIYNYDLRSRMRPIAP